MRKHDPWPMEVRRRAFDLMDNGYTNAEIAKALGKTREAIAAFKWRNGQNSPYRSKNHDWTPEQDTQLRMMNKLGLRIKEQAIELKLGINQVRHRRKQLGLMPIKKDRRIQSRITFGVPDVTAHRIRDRASARGVTVSEYIRSLLVRKFGDGSVSGKVNESPRAPNSRTTEATDSDGVRSGG